MALFRLDNISHAFGDNHLLENASMVIHAGEKLCLLGRNGTGKSTLLKIIAGELLPDSGDLQRKQNLSCTFLSQTLIADSEQTVYQYVLTGLGQIGSALVEFQSLSNRLAQNDSAADLVKLQELQNFLDAHAAWQVEHKVSQVIQQFQLQPSALLKDLSGGWRRKLGIAQALVAEPDVLILDEPTNHLDITSIEVVEAVLKQYKGTLIFISHDRSFVNNIASRIIDLDRGKLSSWPGNLEKYLQLKEESLHAEAKAQQLFDKKLAQEEVWIRQGIKARRTRNEGRVRALKDLRKQKSAQRYQLGVAKMNLQQAEQSGKVVVEFEQASFAYDEQVIFNDFSCQISQGDKIGIIGPNGCGKSTLIKIMQGLLPVQSGSVKLGTGLQVAYFDQKRSQLDYTKSVQDNIADGQHDLVINGQSRHVLGYLQDFMFTPQRARSPIEVLSGGEINRLLLAKIFLKPCNFLIMDEPTNDLDVETLELLEDKLTSFAGTLILVSHDRAFIDNVVTSVLAFEQAGLQEYVGGYSDWQQYHQTQQANYQQDSGSIASKPVDKTKQSIQVASTQLTKAEQSNTKAKKLSYKEQRQLDELPAAIELLDKKIADLQALVNQADFFSQEHDKTQPILDELGQLEQCLQEKYQCWEQLEEKAAALNIATD